MDYEKMTVYKWYGQFIDEHADATDTPQSDQPTSIMSRHVQYIKPIIRNNERRVCAR